MKRILDYDEMNELLNSFDKNVIKKCEPIGFTSFGYPIDHYLYGHGDNHVIITGGTHSSELISNIFVIRFMEKLSNGEISVDDSLYTLHFIPFVNPEGTVIVTKAIRSLIPADMDESLVQTYCLTYYRNSHIEGDYSLKYGDNGEKLQQMMFRHADYNLLDGALKESVKGLFEKYDLPAGCMINWSSNGRGVDLNSNIESSSFIDRVLSDEKIYSELHLNNIRRDLPGPVGMPFFEEAGLIEPENKALLSFYKKIDSEHNLIGSFIYHSCGDIVYYLDDFDMDNPWNENFSLEDVARNLEVASKYAEVCGYKLGGQEKYTTMDSKIKSLFPVTLLIELGSVRAHPLSQFMDFDLPGSDDKFKLVYSKIIEKNTKALLDTLPLMLEVKNRA